MDTLSTRLEKLSSRQRALLALQLRGRVALATTGLPGDTKQLIAYVVPNPPERAAPDRDEKLVPMLRSFLGEHLPDYMVPQAFVLLDAMPRTPNGKIDRQALPVPGRGRDEPDAGFAAPVTELERTIVTVWQQVLQRDHVGIRDNFFDLGGHSLLAMQVYSQLQAHFNGHLAVVDLFTYPTVSSLAEYLSREAGSDESPDESPDASMVQEREERRQKRKQALQQLRQRERR